MRRLVFPLLLVLAVAPFVAAQTDVFCICSEMTEGCGGNIDVGAFSQRTIYFVLKGPSAGGLSAWEAKIEVDGSDNYFGSWALTSGLNVASVENEYIVGLGPTLLVPNSNGLAVLMSMNVLVMGESPIRFFIKPIPGSLAFSDSPGYVYRVNPGSLPEDAVYEYYPCESCAPSEILPAFSINLHIEDDEREWGEVKTIYGR